MHAAEVLVAVVVGICDASTRFIVVASQLAGLKLDARIFNDPFVADRPL